MITLNDGFTTVEFPDGTTWVDEFTYTTVVQAAERSIQGSLIIDLQQEAGGQPITLRSTDSESGWMPKSDVDQLTTWARIVGKELTLNLRGVILTVMLRHHEPPAFECAAVTPFDDPDSEDPYTFTLRLLDVTP